MLQPYGTQAPACLQPLKHSFGTCLCDKLSNVQSSRTTSPGCSFIFSGRSPKTWRLRHIPPCGWRTTRRDLLIDKTLAEPRAKIRFLMSASVSSDLRPKAPGQLRHALPMVAGSSSSISNKWPSQSQTRGYCPRSPGISQDKTKQPSFLQAWDAPTEQYQQGDEFLRSAVLDRFPCGQNKDTIKTFL